MSVRECDVIVVGAGIAGTTAAMMVARYGHRVIVVEQMGPGGQIINATHIENLSKDHKSPLKRAKRASRS
jgi:thioredoxin reductase (NADPH)